MRHITLSLRRNPVLPHHSRYSQPAPLRATLWLTSPSSANAWNASSSIPTTQHSSEGLCAIHSPRGPIALPTPEKTRASSVSHIIRLTFAGQIETMREYVVGSKSFRPDQLFKVTEIKQLCYFST